VKLGQVTAPVPKPAPACGSIREPTSPPKAVVESLQRPFPGYPAQALGRWVLAIERFVNRDQLPRTAGCDERNAVTTLTTKKAGDCQLFVCPASMLLKRRP